MWVYLFILLFVIACAVVLYLLYRQGEKFFGEEIMRNIAIGLMISASIYKCVKKENTKSENIVSKAKKKNSLTNMNKKRLMRIDSLEKELDSLEKGRNKFR